MSHHDERLLAEQLDAFLDELAVAPESLPAADAATARAMAVTAAAMEPDPAFVARLEQRLRAMPHPAAPSARRPLGAWLDALLRPAGRLAWIALLTLVVVTLTLWVRTLSQHPGEWDGEPAQPAPAPVVSIPAPPSGTREAEPTATMLDETLVTTPVATSTPAEELTIPTLAPTATATEEPVAAPLPPTATATAIVEAPPAPFAAALDLSPEGWSPDGRFVLYRTHTAADREINPQYTPGDFLVLDTQQPDSRCTQVVDHRELRPHLWLNERDLLYVTDRDEVVVWPVCADERPGWTEHFPEIPLTILAASLDRSRFVYRGATRYWLFDTGALEAQPVEGLTDEEVGDTITITPGFPVLEANSAAWSPDGGRLAITFKNGDTGVVDGVTGALIQRIEALSIGGLGAPSPPVWLSETELLILNTRQGTLLVTVGEEPRFVEELFFDKEPVPPTMDGVQHQTWVAVDEASGVYHLVHVTRGDGGGSIFDMESPYAKLYHSETGEVEDIWFAVHNGLSFVPSAFSEDGRLLLLELSLMIENTFQQEAWFRPLDPPGSQHYLVAGTEWQIPRLSPDGRWVAAHSEAGIAVFDAMTGAMTRQWPLQGLQPMSWSPDGRWLLATTAQESGEQFRLLAVEP